MRQTDRQRAQDTSISNKAFRRKYGVKTKKKKRRKTKRRVKKQWKTKKQRRQWWNSLTPDEQAEKIKEWMARKAARRKAKSLREMSKIEGVFDCADCFHRKTKSCTDDMPNGCEYWFSPGSKIQGLAYK